MSTSSSTSPPRRKCQRVSLQEIEDATENFDERYALRQWGEAKVYSARIMLGGSEMTQVAVHVKHMNPNSNEFTQVIRMMPKIQHPNVVSLLGYCDDSGRKIPIYEYMANGSLADHLGKKQTPTVTSATTVSLSWQQRLKICLGAALGLKHLHDMKKEFYPYFSIHRQFNPSDILLDANWVAKISCFDAFKPLDAGSYEPVYARNRSLFTTSDVYTFGMVLGQVLCGRMPPGEWHLAKWLPQNVDSKIQGEISNYCLNAFTGIIRKCLRSDPFERPTMDEVVLSLQEVLDCQEAEGIRICQSVSLEEIKEATENFNEQYALGQGGEAKVYLAGIMLGRSKITHVAVKHLKPNSFGFEDEIRIMPKIQHPNIVSLLGYCNDSGQKILIYEYMANGSLADFLQKKQNPTAIDTTTKSLSWQQRLKICVGVALGLKHLHAETNEFAKGIIHRDIKPGNILLDANWVAKISDFGMFKLSRADQMNSTMPTMIKGTGGYYAPEYLNYGHITRKIDVYAFGVVLFQLLCRKMPWDREGESYFRTEDEDLGEWARQNVDPEIRGEVSDYCLNAFSGIIQKCLSMDPHKRPMMDEVALNLQMLWNASNVRTI